MALFGKSDYTFVKVKRKEIPGGVWRFIMGSMGSVVGERITRTVEYATEHGFPVVKNRDTLISIKMVEMI